MNRRGQALIEFVLILPVVLFILLAIFDIGMIFSNRNVLENDSTDVIILYKGGNSIDDIRSKYKDITIDTVVDGNFEKIVLKKKMKIVTPGLNLVFGNPYEIVVERYINYDE